MGCVTLSGNAQAVKLKHMEIQRMKKQIEKRNKQINFLQKKNTELKSKRNQRLQQISQQIRQDNIAIIQFDEDGKAQTSNQQEVGVVSLLKCTICQQEYDLIQRLPWMVCANQHTYCSSCINGMLKRKRNQCPQCRQSMTAGNRNAHLCLLIQNMTQKNTDKKSGPPIQLNISVNKKNNANYDKYIFTQVNMIMKGDDYGWCGLLFNQVLPPQGRIKFCVQVLFSLHNNIQIGIIDLATKVQKGKMSNKRTSFHLFDGRIMASGSIDKPYSSWAPTGKRVQKGVSSKIVVCCNMDNNKIQWYVNDQLHGQAVISDYLKYAKCVPYISMYHAEDVVMLNAW